MAPSRMITLDSDIFKCCQNITTLGWQQDDTARKLLQRAADEVAPIMARRNWRVVHVREFYPRANNLLGLNHDHGAAIDIRLRQGWDRQVFLDYHEIVGTLLHELVHIDIGPHDASFYKLLDVLRCEYDDETVRRVGGRSVGGRAQSSRAGAAEQAGVAAARRRNSGALMPRGGRALGGSEVMGQIGRLCDPREMAVAAAERRRLDDIWCRGVVMGGRDQAIDLDGDGDGVVVVVEEEEEDVIEVAVRGGRGRGREGARSRVPIRENAAALAALQRAGSNSAGLR